MKILRPVDATKRLPDKFIITQVLVDDRICVGVFHPEKTNIFPHGCFSLTKEKAIMGNVTHWYEEIEIESLFPDDDMIYTAGCAATNKQCVKTMFYQEGCSFFKNHILKMLKK